MHKPTWHYLCYMSARSTTSSRCTYRTLHLPISRARIRTTRDVRHRLAAQGCSHAALTSALEAAMQRRRAIPSSAQPLAEPAVKRALKFAVCSYQLSLAH